jgi:acyl-CoA thioesterase I
MMVQYAAPSRRAVLRVATQMALLITAFNGPFASAAVAAEPVKLVVFGDSLTAGFGVAPNEAFPAQLESVLKARGKAVQIINAGVSGDTASVAVERFDWAIPDGTQAVILEFGGNDGLRGIDPKETRGHLTTLITKLKARGIQVLLAGMKAPRNWGDDYAKAFDAMYADLATQHGVALYSFFLEGVAIEKDLNQSDGIHPNAKGVAEIVKRILPSVEALIASTSTKPDKS